MNYLELINVQIGQCKFSDSQLKNITEKLQTISNLYIRFTELNLKNEKVDSQLREIQLLIQKLIDHYQQRRYRLFFDSEKSRLINEIPYKIGLLCMNLQTKEKQLETLTTSDLMRQSIIQLSSIQIEAQIILKHSSIKELETKLSFEFQDEEDQDQVFSLYVKRKTLFYKLLMKVEFHDDQKWLEYFESKRDKKDILFFYILRNRKEKLNSLFSPSKCFIIKNSYRIYLCSGMKIICGEAREILIADCSAPKNTKVHEQFQSNCIASSSQKGSITAPGYNYIKLQYLTLENTYEFYLKNQNMDLEEYMPGIKAILCNDEKGFYLTCKDDQEIKLYPYNELVTTSSDLPFCVQLSKECTMEVRFNRENLVLVELK